MQMAVLLNFLLIHYLVIQMLPGVLFIPNSIMNTIQIAHGWLQQVGGHI